MADVKNNLAVIVPVYNEEKNINNLLENLDAQTVKGFEVIIVDDGSTDKTIELVLKYQTKNISLKILRQENMGAAKARENAIRYAQKKYVAIVDCDDNLSNDALEKAMLLFDDEKVDISLFNLYYLHPDQKHFANRFKYYTKMNIVEGNDAFENCISYWGIHAFGIYKKDVFIKSYKIYEQLNLNNINFLNNDEIISRICFSQSARIAISSGNYFFVNNIESTTRRVNGSYYKVINNSFYLLRYIVEIYISKNKKNLINEACKLIVSTIWGVLVRYKKWKKYLNVDEKKLWLDLIRNSANEICVLQKNKKISLTVKSTCQLAIIKYSI